MTHFMSKGIESHLKIVAGNLRTSRGEGAMGEREEPCESESTERSSRPLSVLSQVCSLFWGEKT